MKILSKIKKLALGETIAPPDVDTMRDDVCPVCSSTDSFNGSHCLVCNFDKPPSMFMDPDVELASQIDLRQDQQIDQVNPVQNMPGQGDQVTDDLICPECGSEFTSADAMNQGGDPHFAPAAQGDPAVNDLMDPNAENEEDQPNTGGAIPNQENTKPLNEPDQDVSNNPTQNDDPTVIPDKDDDSDGDPDKSDDVSDDDTDDDNSTPDKSDNPFKKKKSSLNRFIAAKDDDDDDKDDSLDKEDTSENNTDSPDDIGDDVNSNDENVDPTNSDQPQQANGDSDGMQDPTDAPADPNNQTNPNAPLDPNVPVDPTQDPNAMVDPNQQYNQDVNQEAETGYQVGDICPNCGQGLLEKNTGVSAGTEQIPTIPPQGDVNPTDDPATSEDIPKTSGLIAFQNDQSMSNNAQPEGAYGMANPAASERAALRAAMNQQAKVAKRAAAGNHQERLLRQAAEARIATLENMFLRMAQLIEADSDPVLRNINEYGYQRQASLVRQASLIRVADERDPAQPVPEPSAGSPVVTEQEAATPAARTDVTQLGATPITDVSADATIAVDQPYGEVAFEPMSLNEVDVTQPIAGTTGHLPPEQTIIPVEVRVGDPDRPEPSFPITWGNTGPGPVGGSVGTGGAPAQRAPGSPPGVQPGTSSGGRDRTYASLRLARLRIQAGIAPADSEDIVIASSIDGNAEMTDARIRDEVATLQGVISQRQSSKVASRSSVPRSTEPTPSFMGSGPIQASASLAAVENDEFWSE